MGVGEVIAALEPLALEVVQLIEKAKTAKTEEHDQIMAELQGKHAAMGALMDQLPATIAADNAEVAKQLGIDPPKP